MTKLILPPVFAALVLLAGCGGSDKDTVTPAETPAASAAPTSATAAASDSADAGSDEVTAMCAAMETALVAAFDLSTAAESGAADQIEAAWEAAMGAQVAAVELLPASAARDAALEWATTHIDEQRHAITEAGWTVDAVTEVMNADPGLESAHPDVVADVQALTENCES